MIRTLASGAALVACAASTLAGQQVSLRLGGLHARYADSLTGDAGSLGAHLQWDRPWSRTILDASYAQFASGGGALQAWGSGVTMRPIGARSALGLNLGGVFNSATSTIWTGNASAEAFGATVVRGWTLTLGVSGGAVRGTDTSLIGTGGLALRAHRTIGSVTLSTSATAMITASLRYADGLIAVDWKGRKLSAGLLAGARAGDLGNSPWVQSYGQLRITNALAIEAGVGSYPRDLTGFTRGFYFNAGIRVALCRPATADASTLPESAPPEIMVEARGDSTKLTVVVRDAETVAIAGSWNDWVPVPLELAGGNRWAATLPFGAGTWRFALLVNDDRWIVPLGVTTLPDDFGGQVGVLVLRR